MSQTDGAGTSLLQRVRLLRVRFVDLQERHAALTETSADLQAAMRRRRAARAVPTRPVGPQARGPSMP